jgi:uncharacterized membrane protein YcaP (DUF421 family)
MNETINVIFRTILVLIILFFLFKIMGKKQVSQMSMFDYITGITIGSIVADISLDIEKNLKAGITCLLIYCFTDLLLSYLSLKSIKLRNFFNGKEVILIENGVINRKNMSKNQITINILETEARINGYFNLNEINNSILEPNGKISFEAKENNKPITKKDMNIKTNNNPIVYNIIIDGEIVDENLRHVNKDRKWLNHELKVLGKRKEEILLLTLDSNEKINIYPKH